MTSHPRGPVGGLRCLVLSRQDHGEADRIVRLLSAERGRSTAIARSARRAGARFGAALEPLSLVELGLRARAHSMDVLEHVELVEPHLRLRDDLDRLTQAAHAAEVCGGLAREEHPEPRLFGLCQTALLVLDAATAAPGLAFRLGLEAKALTFAGLLAPLDRCAACGRPAQAEEDAPWLLTAAEGAALHAACGSSGTMCSASFLIDLEAARRRPLQDSLDLDLPAGPRWALAERVEAQLNRPLRARALLSDAPCLVQV